MYDALLHPRSSLFVVVCRVFFAFQLNLQIASFYARPRLLIVEFYCTYIEARVLVGMCHSSSCDSHSLHPKRVREMKTPVTSIDGCLREMARCIWPADSTYNVYGHPSHVCVPCRHIFVCLRLFQTARTHRRMCLTGTRCSNTPS